MKVTCTKPHFGLHFATDEINNRAFIQDVEQKSSASNIFSSLRATRNKIRGAYIVSIAGKPIFTVDEAIDALQNEKTARSKSILIEFAPERRLPTAHLNRAIRQHDLFKPDTPNDEIDHVPTISTEDIRHIATHLFPEHDFSENSVSHDMIQIAINAITSHKVTPEEQAIGRFTRKKLKKLSTWSEWQLGEYKQLDQFHTLKMYGEPVPRPPNAIVLRSHWTYLIKRDGTRRSRNCCDGSKRSAPILHSIVSTYSSCTMQPIQRLFYSLAAALNYLVYGGDAQDAYAHSPPPEQPTFLAIDDAFAEWYKERFKVEIDRSYVLPVLHALQGQGHPESGRLWESHITRILSDMGFTSTTHDKSIYTAVIHGERVLLLRQVDDFALACSNEALAKQIYSDIGKKLQLQSETKVPFTYLGLIHDFNGIDVHQYSDSIVLSSKSYIQRVLTTHGWDTSNSVDTKRQITPLHPDAVSSMFAHIGPSEGTKEHASLAKKHGFSFRKLLGELLYAYVTCRPDIGYATVTLSKFSANPHDIHYSLLKLVAKYLRETIDWGIRFQRPSVNKSLPVNPMQQLQLDPKLPAFPSASSSTSLVGFVDAAHGNDLRTRRSTTGYAFMINGGAIAYRCKTQSITATSSTEAEFLAAVTAATQARYFCSVLLELGFKQKEPTTIYEDNISAINMINSRVPTERSRHIDIQYFAIQDWKEAGDIAMKFLPGIINAADDLTKPLGWILHERHARRLLGHYNYG